MFWKREKKPQEICCPYCGKPFRPEELLFCDFDGDRVMDDQQYDPVYAKFISGMIPFDRVALKSGDFIEMARRPKYFFHPWHKDYSKEKPFTKPIKIENSTEHDLYPSTITVYRKNGLTPAMLETGGAAAEQAQAEGKLSGEGKNGLFDREQEHATSDRPTFSGDATSRLRTKACPHCHCMLPENVGLYPMHRVVMLGSTRAGKTTYMTLAAHQLASGVGMPAGLVSDCVIGEESARYFDYLVNCLKANVVPATLLMKKDMIQVVFPIVVTVRPKGGYAPFFLVINDCPGEAMNDGHFLDDFTALRDAIGAILMMDPCQFTGVLKEDVHKVEEQGLHMDVCDQQFNRTLDKIKPRLSEFKKLCQIAMTLTKLDLIYGEGPDYRIQRGMYPYMDKEDLREQHANAIDLEWINQLSLQVSGAITRQLNYEAYAPSLDSVLDHAREVNITTLCCSIRTWNNAERKFIMPSGIQGENQNVNMLGYRLLEPLLCILGQCGLLPAKDA